MFKYDRKRCTIKELAGICGISKYQVSKDVNDGVLDLHSIVSIHEYLLIYSRSEMRVEQQPIKIAMN